MPHHKTTHKALQKLRIIGGQWRSRQILFDATDELRPTGDRIRETLFNWLAPVIQGARCLDLFAGSGALSFEALSRGASQCTALEQQAAAVTQLRTNRSLLNAENLAVVFTDSRTYLRRTAPENGFNIVFVDPPFDAQLHNSVCRTLDSNGWLAPDASIYCELPASDSHFTPPKNWRQLREKITGGVKYSLYLRIESDA